MEELKTVFVLKQADYDDDYYDMFEDRDDLLAQFKQALIDNGAAEEAANEITDELDQYEFADDVNGIHYTIEKAYLHPHTEKNSK